MYKAFHDRQPITTATSAAEGRLRSSLGSNRGHLMSNITNLRSKFSGLRQVPRAQGERSRRKDLLLTKLKARK